MRSNRVWLAHNYGTSLQHLIGCAGIAASLFLVGCGTPTFEGVTTSLSGSDGATSLSVAIPPGSETESAELLIAFLGIQANPNTSGPPGWTPLPGMDGFNGATCQADGRGVACQLSVYYKIADGSETTAEFSWGGSRGAVAAVLRYSNVDPAGPIGVIRPQRGSSAGPTAPVVTTTRDDSRVLRIVVIELDEVKPFLTGSLALTEEASTSRLNLVSFSDAATDPTNGCGPPLSQCDATERAVAIGVADDGLSTAGGAGPANWEMPGPDQWMGVSIEILRPPEP